MTLNDLKNLNSRERVRFFREEISKEKMINSDFNYSTPRLLFRSKGPRKQYHPLDEPAGIHEAR